MPNLPWKPWHEVVALRDDLKTGELSLHMFAADLYEVLMQRGKQPVYEEPDNFFSLTFPTHNLVVAKKLVSRKEGVKKELHLTGRFKSLAPPAAHRSRILYL
jgi:predicted AAA+ superfamily ATPase